MSDLSPEALTEGPLKHKRQAASEMDEVPPAPEGPDRGDVEALAAGAGTRAGTGSHT